MAEPIVIVLQTYRRTDVALRTIQAAHRHLRYGGDLLWYVADDGSPAEHYDAVLGALSALGATVAGQHSERRGYGGNCNVAWAAADAIGALTFWLEDDWELTRDVDLYPYAALLMERDDIGMVRLGYLGHGITAELDSHGGHLYWLINREPVKGSCYAFTGHPSLRHRRYYYAYGDYPVGHPPGETEVIYAHNYRFGDGPWIAWPAAWPELGYFSHIGTVKTETML